MCPSDPASGTFEANVKAAQVWRPDDQDKPSPSTPDATEIYRPDVLATIEATIQELDKELRTLSIDIHGTYG